MNWIQKNITAGHRTCDGIHRKKMNDASRNAVVENAVETRAIPLSIFEVCVDVLLELL